MHLLQYLLAFFISPHWSVAAPHAIKPLCDTQQPNLDTNRNTP
jgi:hypothetical protein